MNLETQLPPALWAAISSNYEKRIYTAAIQDGVYYLSDLIRKSHGKHTDTQDDATAIILFISYLVRQIDQARAPFSRDEFVGRVLERGYVPTPKYSNLLVAEIPPGEVLEVFIAVYSRKDEFATNNAAQFFPVLLGRMNPEQHRHVRSMVSDELKLTDEDETIRFIISCFGQSLWGQLEDIARMRIEHRLLKSIRKGRYDKESRKCLDGSLGTWLTSIADGLLLKEEAVYALLDRLWSEDATAREYGYQYLFGSMDKLAEEPPTHIKRLVKRRISEKDRTFCENLVLYQPWKNELWEPETIEAFNALKKELEVDDIPV